jgi:predicted chitinase
MDNLKSILSSFKLKNELNPKIWDKSKNEYILNPKVRTNLLEIAYDFIESLDVDIVISDIIMTGSLSNYNWSNYSDVDLHIIADFDQFPKNSRELYGELFHLKKTVYGIKHNLKIFGYDVELYIEDETISRDVKSAGRYSILHNEWDVKPPKESINIKESGIKEKAKKWMKIIDDIEDIVDDKDIESAKKLIKTYATKIRKYRECGLEKGGEYSEENLVFKILRRNGYLDKLKDMKNKVVDKKLSLKEAVTTVGEFKVDLENGPANHGSRALGNWQSDNAWDVFAPAGTVVNSYTDGVVSKIFDNGKKSGKIFGTQLTIKGENGYPDIFYTHITDVNLSVGDKIKVGEYVGKIIEWCTDESCTKKMSGTHVHIGLPQGNTLKDLINNKVYKNSGEGETNYERHLDVEEFLDNLFETNSELEDKNFDDVLNQVQESKFLQSLIKVINTTDDKLKNLKSPNSKIPYNKDVEIIQTALQFLGFSLPKWGVDGLFGNETESAVKSFQKEYDLTEDGTLNNDDLKVLLTTLILKDFTDDNLNKIQKYSDVVVNGDVDFSRGGFNRQQVSNINLIINELNERGITNPFTQVGILSVIAKESNFKSFKEFGYSSTSNSRIRSIFGNRANRYSDSDLTKLKQNDEDFFEAMYGMNSGMRLGNTMPGDGWKYIGRGLNGLTGRANYKKYGDLIGLDLESKPELLERPEIAAKAAVAYFTKNKSANSLPNFDNKEDAINYFADLNAGGRSSFSRVAANKSSQSFDVVA